MQDIILTILVLFVVKLCVTVPHIVKILDTSFKSQEIRCNIERSSLTNIAKLLDYCLLDQDMVKYVEDLLVNNFQKTNTVTFKNPAKKFPFVTTDVPIFSNLIYKYEYDSQFTQTRSGRMYNFHINKDSFVEVTNRTFETIRSKLFGFVFYFAIMNSITDRSFDYTDYVEFDSKTTFNDNLRKMMEHTLGNKLGFIVGVTSCNVASNNRMD